MPNLTTTLTNASLAKHVSNSMTKEGYVDSASYLLGYNRATVDLGGAPITFAEAFLIRDARFFGDLFRTLQAKASVVPGNAAALLVSIDAAGATGVSTAERNGVLDGVRRDMGGDAFAYFEGDAQDASFTLSGRELKAIAKQEVGTPAFDRAIAKLLVAARVPA